MDKDINIGDILPPNKNVPEKFITAEDRVPQFLKTSAYEPDETRVETIKRDWERLTQGLSDYVLAEQLTEYELRGMGKPVAENYSMYFTATLSEVRKNRKKAEQRLFKFIPAHSQLDCEAFFKTVHEQNEKEKEARLKSIELYPRAGVAKLDYADDARKGLKKEAAAWCQTCGKDAKPGDPAHDKHTVVDLPPNPDPKEEAAKRQEKMDLKKEALGPDTRDYLCSCGKTFKIDKVDQHKDYGHKVELAPGQDLKKEATGPHTKMDPKEEEELLKDLEKIFPKKKETPKEPPKKEAMNPSDLTPAGPPKPSTNLDKSLCAGCGKDVEPGRGTPPTKGKTFCMPCHDSGASTPPPSPLRDPGTSDVGAFRKEAAAKWTPGTELEAKHNGAKACVAYVNDEDKTYVVKVDGTMYPSYYSYEDAHNTFDAIKKKAAAATAPGAAGDASGVSGSPGGAVTVTITNTHTDHNPAETSTRTDHNPAETGDSGAGADAKILPAPAPK